MRKDQPEDSRERLIRLAFKVLNRQSRDQFHSHPRTSLHLLSFFQSLKKAPRTRGSLLLPRVRVQQPYTIIDHLAIPWDSLPRNNPKLISPEPPSTRDYFRFIALLLTLAHLPIGLSC